MTTMPHPSVANLLSTVFAIDNALSELAITRHMDDPRMRKGTPLGDAIRKELVELYQCADTDWISLVQNEKYEAYPAKNQEDGRNFVTQRIWNVLFPEWKDNAPTPSA